ncbi:hypothetical protein EBR56_07275 [bacterium]|nr:hypothetical protein [bacterium]
MREAAGRWGFILGLNALATAVTVGWKIASLRQLGPGQEYESPFFHAMATSDWLGAVIATAFLAAAPLVPRRLDGLAQRLVAGVAGRTAAIAAVVVLVLGVCTQLVHRDYPYAMDEFAATFQAEVFAAGKTSGQWPPYAAPLMVSPLFATGQFFYCNYETGRIISQYWPCHALLLAPFAFLDATWALNPLLAGVAILLIGSLARHVAGEKGAGLAVLLTLASPAFYAYGISFYSMMSHLVANLLYARLLVQPTPGRSVAAGLIGGIALALHNPFPHGLFAAPWIVWLLGSRRWVPAALVVACSLTVFGLIDGVWSRTKDSVRQSPTAVAVDDEEQASPDQGVAATLSWREFASRAYSAAKGLCVPSVSGALAGRTYSLVREIAWDAPGLVGLAFLACVIGVRGPASALAGSAVCTLAGYAFVPFDPGLGWGSRYMFSTWFALPVLAAIALTPSTKAGQSLTRCIVWAAVGSALVCVPLRLFEIRSFIDSNLRRSPAPLLHAAAADLDRVWFFLAGGDDARQDFIRNDPLFRHGPFILYGQGQHQDAKNIRLIAAQLGLEPFHGGSNPVGDMWVLEPPGRPPAHDVK